MPIVGAILMEYNNNPLAPDHVAKIAEYNAEQWARITPRYVAMPGTSAS
jgi:hypothetical protein